MSEIVVFGLLFLLLIGLIACSAFLSSSEIALFSLSRAKLLAYKDDPSPARRRVHWLMADYHATLISIILGNMFVNTLISMLNEEILGFFKLGALATTVLSALMGIVLLLLFSEITPMTIAYAYCEKWSEKVATPIWLLRKLTFPVVVVVESVCNKVLDLLGRRKPKPLNHMEHLSYLETCLERGAFSEWEGKLLRGAFSLRDKTVGEVMRSRVDLPFMKAGTPPEEVIAVLMESRQSQLPSGSGAPDDADMVFSSREFFMLSPEERELWWESSCVKRAVFIPSACSLTKALRTMRAKGAHAALATDEYGGFGGVICLQDIYSELVGRSVEEEEDVSEWQALKTGPKQWTFDGLCALPFIEETSGWKAPEGLEAKTAGGLICELLGRLPSKGDSLNCKGAEIEAGAVFKNRVTRVLITLSGDEGRPERDSFEIKEGRRP